MTTPGELIMAVNALCNPEICLEKTIACLNEDGKILYTDEEKFMIIMTVTVRHCKFIVWKSLVHSQLFAFRREIRNCGFH